MRKIALTTQIIVKNNETTIENALNSILPLNSHIIIGDLGCQDSTIDKCRLFNAEIIKVSLNNDFSQVRNFLTSKSQTSWNFYIEPWETLLTPDVVLKDDTTYNLNIIQGDIVTKSLRFWHKSAKLKFVNPVFEYLPGPAKNLEIYLASNFNERLDLNAELTKKWLEDKPLMTDPIYYHACICLAQGNIDTFLNIAESYLYQEKKDLVSVTMTQYHCAKVYCYAKKDFQNAAKFLFPCLAKKPLMAEFWCLLGDIYYRINQYDKAKCFYENAIILGSKRLKTDNYPLEISKYKEYPETMIKSCDEIQPCLRQYKPQVF